MRLWFLLGVLACACGQTENATQAQLETPIAIEVAADGAGGRYLLIANADSDVLNVVDLDAQTFVPAPVVYFPLNVPVITRPVALAADRTGTFVLVASSLTCTEPTCKEVVVLDVAAAVSGSTGVNLANGISTARAPIGLAPVAAPIEVLLLGGAGELALGSSDASAIEPSGASLAPGDDGVGRGSLRVNAVPADGVVVTVGAASLEIDRDGSFAAGNVAVVIPGTDPTPVGVASALIAAVNASALGASASAGEASATTDRFALLTSIDGAIEYLELTRVEGAAPLLTCNGNLDACGPGGVAVGGSPSGLAVAPNAADPTLPGEALLITDRTSSLVTSVRPGLAPVTVDVGGPSVSAAFESSGRYAFVAVPVLQSVVVVDTELGIRVDTDPAFASSGGSADIYLPGVPYTVQTAPAGTRYSVGCLSETEDTAGTAFVIADPIIVGGLDGIIYFLDGATRTLVDWRDDANCGAGAAPTVSPVTETEDVVFEPCAPVDAPRRHVACSEATRGMTLFVGVTPADTWQFEYEGILPGADRSEDGEGLFSNDGFSDPTLAEALDIQPGDLLVVTTPPIDSTSEECLPYLEIEGREIELGERLPAAAGSAFALVNPPPPGCFGDPLSYAIRVGDSYLVRSTAKPFRGRTRVGEPYADEAAAFTLAPGTFTVREIAQVVVSPGFIPVAAVPQNETTGLPLTVPTDIAFATFAFEEGGAEEPIVFVSFAGSDVVVEYRPRFEASGVASGSFGYFQ